MAESQMDAFDGVSEGRRRLERVLKRHDDRNRALLAEVRRRVRDRALGRADMTANADDAMDVLDDVLREERELGYPATEPDRRFLGALWRRDGWRKTGEHVPSARPERHARPIPVWQWVGGRP